MLALLIYDYFSEKHILLSYKSINVPNNQISYEN